MTWIDTLAVAVSGWTGVAVIAGLLVGRALGGAADLRDAAPPSR